MSLGDRVKAAREGQRLSRAKLAHEAGVSYAFVQQLETGVRKDPGVKNLGAIASVLGMTVDSLLAEKGSSKADSSEPAIGRPTPARAEIDQLLDELSADELVSARDLLRVWTGGTASKVSQPT